MVEELKRQVEVERLMSPEGETAILDFWSPTCGPCAAMAPAFEAVAEAYANEPIRFLKINTAEQANLAAPFRVRSVPTLLFLHRGQILDVRVGALDARGLQKKADWLLAKARGDGLFKRLFGGKKKADLSAHEEKATP